MNFEIVSQLAQTQKTVISQKMIEHLEILQMPGFDLSQHIAEMLNTNPLLECDAPVINSETEELPDYLKEWPSEKSGSDNGEEPGGREKFLSFSKTALTLREYLRLQLLELKLLPGHRKIVEYLIENLDYDGYLRERADELAGLLRQPEKNVVQGIKILQAMEPAGVGAYDLKECLLLQLKRRKLLNTNIANVIENYFNLLAGRSFSKIARETGITREEAEQIHSLIKSLDPKPGSGFQKNEWEQYIVPDLILKELDGKYFIEYNEESIPSVRINNYYVKLLENSQSDREVRDYIKKNLSGAIWLVKVIEQRKKTILDIAHNILDIQEDFFRKGHGYLKPLTMKMIADRLGIHTSTVSRAINGKFLQTPRGVFSLKFFFSSTIEAEQESNASAVSVKDMIRQIVLEEDKRKPLSDEQIKVRLECKGIKVARRTIAKYREELSLLPAAMRKCL